MSQVSIIDIFTNNPQIPTEFIADIGSAIPIANIIEILGSTVPAGVLPVYTEASGNTLTVNVQIAQAIAASNALNVGLAAFNSNTFTVDANGFVSLIVPLTVPQGGTGQTTLTDGAVLIGNGVSPIQSVSLTNGQLLIGRTGLDPIAGGIITANTTVQFLFTSPNIVQDFGLTNLLIGSPGTSIAGAGGNVGLGQSSLTALTSGGNNVCVGYFAGNKLNTSSGSTLVGSGAGINMTSGTNTFIGRNCGAATTTGTTNVCLGGSCYNNGLTGQANILIGNSTANNYVGAESSNIVIGNTGTASESNKIRIGTSGSSAGQQNATFIAGITGVTVASSPVGVASTGQLSDLGFGTIGQIFVSGGAGVSPIWTTQSPDALAWTDVTGTTQAMAINSGYLANNAGLVTLTLPATAAQFSVLKVTGIGAGGWKIAQNANQKIRWLGVDSTVGVSGFLSSIEPNACVTLRAYVGGASTFWLVEASEGNLTIS